MQYFIADCTGDGIGRNGWINLPAETPTEAEKIWTITKTQTALNITCNDVEVVNYVFADSSESSCVRMWGGDIIEKIKFTVYDTASDFYKSG